MKKIIYLTLTIIFTSFHYSFSQTINDPRSLITITASNSTSEEKFKIEINEKSSHYFFELKVQDSISTNKNYENDMEKYRKEYFKLKDTSIKSDSVQAILYKIQSLVEKNTVYSTFKAKITKREDKPFDHLIELFKTENVEYFERREQNKNRFVIDGTMVKITITQSTTKIIRAHSPGKTSHPEINTLITSILNIIREQNPRLKERNLSGY